MNISKTLIAMAFCGTIFVAPSCQPSGPQTDSQTNWLRLCVDDTDCGENSCRCGMCTSTCLSDATCADKPLSECIAAPEHGAIAACDGSAPNYGICLPRCEMGACPEGLKCVADVCVPLPTVTSRVNIDPVTRYQSLIGFGASFSFDEDTLFNHPLRDELFDMLFSEAGFDMIRLRNRFDGDNQADFSITAELYDEVVERLGRKPTIFLSSGSPPAELKENGDTFCRDNDVNCRLIRDDSGNFDYAGYAEYWRSSLETYEDYGIHADYVSIQSHPNWVPPESSGGESARFLPVEGTTDITNADGETVEAEFPGYQEALAAVRDAVSDLGSFNFGAPETLGSLATALNFTSSLDPDSFDTFAVQFYGVDPQVDAEELEALRLASEQAEKPVIQTEIQVSGLITASLVHHALVSAGASAYLHQQFIGPLDSSPALALIRQDDETIEPNTNYYALAHYARATAPNWSRVGGTTDDNHLLISAWLSPGEDELTVILVNPSDEPIEAELSLPEAFADLLAGGSVTRTVFDGDERSADLGELQADQVVRLPAGSIMTVTTKK